MSSLLLRAGGCLESRALQHECLSLHLGCRAVCHQGLCLLTGSGPWEGCARGGRAVPAEEGAALCAAVYCCGQAQCAFISACM